MIVSVTCLATNHAPRIRWRGDAPSGSTRHKRSVSSVMKGSEDTTLTRAWVPIRSSNAAPMPAKIAWSPTVSVPHQPRYEYVDRFVVPWLRPENRNRSRLATANVRIADASAGRPGAHFSRTALEPPRQLPRRLPPPSPDTCGVVVVVQAVVACRRHDSLEFDVSAEIVVGAGLRIGGADRASYDRAEGDLPS